MNSYENDGIKDSHLYLIPLHIWLQVKLKVDGDGCLGSLQDNVGTIYDGQSGIHHFKNPTFDTASELATNKNQIPRYLHKANVTLNDPDKIPTINIAGDKGKARFILLYIDGVTKKVTLTGGDLGVYADSVITNVVGSRVFDDIFGDDQIPANLTDESCVGGLRTPKTHSDAGGVPERNDVADDSCRVHEGGCSVIIYFMNDPEHDIETIGVFVAKLTGSGDTSYDGVISFIDGLVKKS